jgi:hypothetical protein
MALAAAAVGFVLALIFRPGPLEKPADTPTLIATNNIPPPAEP